MNNTEQTIRVYLTLSSSIHIPNQFSPKKFYTLIQKDHHQPNSHIVTNQLNPSANQLKNLTSTEKEKKAQPSILLVELGDRGKSSSQSA